MIYAHNIGQCATSAAPDRQQREGEQILETLRTRLACYEVLLGQLDEKTRPFREASPENKQQVKGCGGSTPLGQELFFLCHSLDDLNDRLSELVDSIRL